MSPPIKFRVRCSGTYHSITYDPSGRIRLHNHSKEELKALASLSVNCRCSIIRDKLIDLFSRLRNHRWPPNNETTLSYQLFLRLKDNYSTHFPHTTYRSYGVEKPTRLTRLQPSLLSYINGNTPSTTRTIAWILSRCPTPLLPNGYAILAAIPHTFSANRTYRVTAIPAVIGPTKINYYDNSSCIFLLSDKVSTFLVTTPPERGIIISPYITP